MILCKISFQQEVIQTLINLLQLTVTVSKWKDTNENFQTNCTKNT